MKARSPTANPSPRRSGKFTFDDAVQDVVTDYRVNGKRTTEDVERRIALHLAPYFGGRRMAAITTDLRAFVAHRQAPVKQDDGTETPGATNAEINRELAIVKLAFRLAVQAGKRRANSESFPS